MSVKQWIAKNHIKENAYYYWLRKFWKEAYDQMQLPTAAVKPEVALLSICPNAYYNYRKHWKADYYVKKSEVLMSVKEIAAAMDVSENAVRSRLMYGRHKIEKKVWELEKQGTKFYSLSPIPFLLLLFRNQEAYAVEVPEVSLSLEKEYSKFFIIFKKLQPPGLLIRSIDRNKKISFERWKLT